MNTLLVLAFIFILEPLLERTYQFLFYYQPVYFKLNAGKAYQAYTAKERITRFHTLRQLILMSTGIFLLAILTGIEMFNYGNMVLKGFFLISLGFILEPVCELIYYRWSVNRYWKEDMTAKEMTAYHDFCERYYRHSFSLNGIGRQKIRFFMLITGICGLLSVSLFIFKF